MTTRRAVLSGGAAAAGTLLTGARAPGDPVVTCRAGRFIGQRQAGVNIFRGIRYGRAVRFRAPVAEPARSTAIRADHFGPACPQRGRRRPQSEDCLHLNIWTTDLDGRAQCPVLVWIHGGAYAFGAPSDPETDGFRLAARSGLVVVSVAHRLNLFGYLYLARLDPAFADGSNAGQRDLVLALEWVRDNIAAFGGDPARITLVGQSGGGAKIATLMAMPSAQGLFHRAVTMSGQQVTVAEPDRADARARALLAHLRVAAPADLQALPPERLLEGLAAADPFEAGRIDTGPVRDGITVPRHPFWPDPAPPGRHVPLMLGGTRDETRDYWNPLSAEIMRLGWPDLAQRIAAELPVAAPVQPIVDAYRARLPEASPADIFYAVTTDGRSWRPQLITAEARARAGHPAWMYQVDFASPLRPGRGAFHGIDIALLFGTLDAAGAGTGTGTAAQVLSLLMQDRLIRFAATGDPNGVGLPAWPAYRLPERPTMIFDGVSRLDYDPRAWQRALFAPHPYRQPGT